MEESSSRHDPFDVLGDRVGLFFLECTEGKSGQVFAAGVNQ